VKNTHLIFTWFGKKVAQGPRKKRVDFGGNPDLDRDPGINVCLKQISSKSSGSSRQSRM